MPSSHADRYCDDEIDLFEIAKQLWQGKWIIAAFVLVFGVLAAIYAYTATPVYEAEVTLKMPAEKDIAWYNKGSYISEELERLRRKDVFDVFLDKLTADSLRMQFFKEVYLPSLGNEKDESSEENLYRQFGERINLRRTDARNFPDNYTLSFQYPDANQSAELLDAYINMAIAASKQELKAGVDSQLRALANVLKLELDKLKRQAEAQRLDDIERISDALYIAKAINLEHPGQLSGKYGLANTPYTDGNPLYLQGTKALEAQLKVLQERKNNEAYIEDYRDIESQWQKVSEMAIDDEAAQVVSFAEESYDPDRPIKPRKLIILATGLMLGGMLGIVFVLARQAMAERSQQ